jgi:hypothetical protein
VTTDAGELVAEFKGVLEGGSFHGTYVDRNGGSGEWHWDGVPPAGLTAPAAEEARVVEEAAPSEPAP